MLIMIEGNAGSGKSKLAAMYANASPMLTCYSNMWLERPHFEFKMSSLLEELKPEEIFGRIILIDEAQNVINSRDFASVSNRLMSFGNAQRRKSNEIVILTFPLHRMIDINFRESCNFIIGAECISEHESNYIVFSNETKEIVNEFMIGEEFSKFLYSTYRTQERIISHQLSKSVKIANTRENYNDYMEQCILDVINFANTNNVKKINHDIVKYVINTSDKYADIDDFEKNVYVRAKIEYANETDETDFDE